MPKGELPEDESKKTGLGGVLEPKKNEPLPKPPTLLYNDPGTVPGTLPLPATYSPPGTGIDDKSGTPPSTGTSASVGLGGKKKAKSTNPDKPR